MTGVMFPVIGLCTLLTGTQQSGNADLGTRRSIASITTHPLYSSVTGAYDVALMKLAEPYDGVEAQLGDANFGNFGQNLRVMGWGVSDITSGAGLCHVHGVIQ